MRFLGEVMRGFVSADSLFAGIEWSTTVHQGPIRNVRGDNPLDQSMFSVTAEGLLKWDSVRNGRIDDYVCFLYDMSESQRKSLARSFFRNITEISDATGRTVDAKGQPLSADMILDLLEKVEFGFDEKGNPLYPTLVLPPAAIEKLKQLKLTPEQERRWKQMIEMKRAQFNAGKRTRRLPR